MPYTGIHLVTQKYYYLWHSRSSSLMGTLMQMPILYDLWSVTYFLAKILCSVSMVLIPCSWMNNRAVSCVRMDFVESAGLTILYSTIYHHETLCWSLCYQQTLLRDDFMLTSRTLMFLILPFHANSVIMSYFSWRPLPVIFNTLKLGYQPLLTQDLGRAGVSRHCLSALWCEHTWFPGGEKNFNIALILHWVCINIFCTKTKTLCC